jgi:acyl carrier protein
MMSCVVGTIYSIPTGLDTTVECGKISLLMVIPSHLSHDEITKALAECLHFLAGDNYPEDASPDLDVLDAWGLDSLHGVELACDLSTRLKISIPLEENPLIEEDRTTGKKRSRTFGEVVEYLAGLAAKPQH